MDEIPTVANYLLEDADDPGRPEMVRGRYRIIDPETGKEKSWTRISNFAGTVSDHYLINRLSQRTLATGLAHNPDLLLQVASIDPDTEPKMLNDICSEARTMAGQAKKANVGSAMHRFTERLDRGEPVDSMPVPDEYLADLDAYTDTLYAAGIQIHPDWIERACIVPELGLAGTFDRIVTMPDGRRLIADLKTGSIGYAWGEWSIQLACYSHASHMWKPDQTLEPMPDVDKEQALIIHMPARQGRCDLYLLDIASGWGMVGTCLTVKAWRNRRDLYTEFEAMKPQEVAEAFDTKVYGADEDDRTVWVHGWLQYIKNNGVAVEMVRRNWPDNVPPKPPWTHEQIDAIDTVLKHAEINCNLPFYDRDPSDIALSAKAHKERVEAERNLMPPSDDAVPAWRGTNTGQLMAPGDVQALRGRIDGLPADRREQARTWAMDGKAHGRPWIAGNPDSMDRREFAIHRAVTECLLALWDDDDPEALTRAAVEAATGLELRPEWCLGAIIGSLDEDGAELLADTAYVYKTGGDKWKLEVVAKVLQQQIARQAKQDKETKQ